MAAYTWKTIVDEGLQELGDNLLIAGKLSKVIQNGSASLHEFVEYLGPQLTDSDATACVKGVQLLVNVCINFRDDFLNEDEVVLLSTFLRDRLKSIDAVVTYALQGIQKLCKSRNLPRAELLAVMTTIFNDVFPQSRTPADRHCVFLIFQHAMYHRLEDLQSMGTDFVSGFIQAVDGERDPHNLIVMFDLVPNIVRNFNIDSFAEELFEVTACYFPIDYARSPKEVRQTTKEDLILSLRACLAASPKFAEYCVPLLLEKLGSTLLSAKLDTLETLTACVPVYGSENMKTFNLELWQCIRRDVFSGLPVEAEKIALDALTAIIKNASSNVVQRNSKDDFGDLMTKIIEECVTCINKPELKLALPAAKLLRATSIASRSAFDAVTGAIVPLLLTNFAAKTESQQRKSIIDILNSFVKSCRDISSNQEVDERPPLEGFKSPLLILYTSVITMDGDVVYRIAAINGLLNLSLVTSLLDESELERVVQLLADITVQNDEHLLRNESQSALAQLTESHSTRWTSHLITYVLRVIESGPHNDSVSFGDWDVKNPTHYEGMLNVLAAITKTDSLDQVVSSVMQELTRNMNDSDTWKTQRNLLCINAIAAKLAPHPTTLPIWNSKILMIMLKLLEGKRVSEFKMDSVDDVELVQHFAVVFETVVPHLDISDSLSLLKTTLDLYKDSDVSLHGGSILILIVESIFNCVRKEIFLDEHRIFDTYIPQYLNKAIAILADANNVEDIASSACRSLASLVNKMPEGPSTIEVIARLIDVVDHRHLSQSSASPKFLAQRSSLLVWITKALLMKGHSETGRFVEELFSYLENEAMSTYCCSRFDVITRDIPNALNCRCHANVRFLYKQRFYVMTNQLLIAGFSKAAETVKHNYLIALVQQLLMLPKEVFKAEVSSMLPVLIQGLSSENATLLSAILTIVLQILLDDSACLEQYADTIIPHLLKLSTNKDSMKVRVDALKCLNALVNLPAIILVKHKKEVLQGLVIPIDDHKRLVRQAAVQARSNWFLLGSPGGS